MSNFDPDNDRQVMVEQTIHQIQSALLDLAEHLSRPDAERFVLMEIRQVEHAKWLLESLYVSIRQRMPRAAE